MCGIAGFVDFRLEADLPDVISAMTNRLVHRGPDGSGFAVFSTHEKIAPDWTGLNLVNPLWSNYLDKVNVSLGHCRLAIVDSTDSGLQPMSAADSQDFWITYNGEIYNFNELRSTLEDAGFLFLSTTDSEVVLNAYRYWGTSCVTRFEGMWSFVIYDRTRGKLFGSRDRLGVKPFYYAHQSNFFAFASEVKAFLEIPDIKPSVNSSAVLSFLFASKIEQKGETFLNDVMELAPGHSFEYDVYRREMSFMRYFNLFPDHSTELPNLEKAKTEFLDLMRVNLNRRLETDLPLGFCLSGGLDSSTLLCVAAQDIGSATAKRLTNSKVFTAKSPGPCDETKYAELVVNFLDLDLDWVKCDLVPDDFFANWKAINYHQDLPIVSMSTFAQFAVMRSASLHHVKVLLGGQGSDELFAGYPDFYVPFWNELLRKGRFRTLLREWRNGKNSPFRLHSFLTEWVKYLLLKLPVYLSKRMLLFARPERKFLSKSGQDRLTKKAFSRLNEFWSLNEALREHVMDGHLKSLLHWEDRCAMQFSIESRTPFADDPNLINYAFSLPAEWKIHDGWTKWIVREATMNLMPNKVRERKDKLGFSVPQTDWLMTYQLNLRELYEYGRKRDSLNIVSQEAIEKSWDKIFSSQLYWKEQNFIFRYVSYLVWLESFDLNP